MSKETLAFDVDEVIFPFLDVFIVDHNEKYGTDLERSIFSEYEFHIPLGLEVPEAVRRIYDFTSRLRGRDIQPIELARESLSKLEKVFELVVITARDSQFEEITLDWASEHFPDQFRELRHIGYGPIMEKPTTKAQVCKELGAKALTDDSLYHVSLCPEVGVEGVLFGDYPWNQAAELPDGVVRCVDWPAVVDHFNA